jgi:hypothetical protein
MVVCLAGLAAISPLFAYETAWSERPTIVAVALMVCAGVLYLRFVRGLPGDSSGSRSLAAILLLGLAARLIFMGSTPVYEDDFYRYFWDGALTAGGISPYQHAPSEALPSPLDAADTRLPDRIGKIAADGHVDRVPYPHLRTVYPPLSVAVFAANHVVSPWGLSSWRCILLLFDAITAALLLALLAEIGRSSNWLAVYWLNPLMIAETTNSAHMDVLLLPFLLATVWLALRSRFRTASLMLAGAVGLKLWPLLLFPLIFRRLFSSSGRLLQVASIFTVATLALLSPQLMARWDDSSGLAVYLRDWETNAFLFGLLQDSLAAIDSAVFDLPWDPDWMARAVAGACMIAALGYFTWRDPVRPCDMFDRLLWFTATLLLLSPTGYPWYFIWLLPWLVFRPSFPLLLLTATLPLYDLRYALLDAGRHDVFENFVVSLEFAPSIVLLAFSFLRRKAAASAPRNHD